MGPGSWQAAHVDGLPSSERGGVGQDLGEMLAALRTEGMAQAGLDLRDVGFQLHRDSRGAEPAVKHADGVSLTLENLDNGCVHIAGAGDLPQQLGCLVAWRCFGYGTSPGCLAGRNAQTDPGVVGHSEPVSDPCQQRQRRDDLLVAGDETHAVLAETRSGCYPHLTDSMLAEQPENGAHV